MENVLIEKEENLQFILAHAGAACRDYAANVKGFHKHSYPVLFENHKKENDAFYASIESLLSGASPDEIDGLCRQIAGAFIRDQEEALGRARRSREKSGIQMDKNMFLVTFVIPTIKAMRNERADRLAEIICEEWGKAFKGSNIQVADYNSIMDGFKWKLFGLL